MTATCICRLEPFRGPCHVLSPLGHGHGLGIIPDEHENNGITLVRAPWCSALTLIIQMKKKIKVKNPDEEDKGDFSGSNHLSLMLCINCSLKDVRTLVRKYHGL